MTAPADRLLSPFVRFVRLESSSGIVLLLSAAVALVWANSPYGETYFRIAATTASIAIGPFSLSKPLLLWVNDGLMAVFFLVVGLEIKREILEGELASPRKAALSVAAALGGMIVPAGIYASLNAGTERAAGWGIPMATDIAFALGALALLGSRVPVALKVFLTAVAIADDLGAVVVIAVFYTSSIALGALGAAAGILALLALANRAGVRHPGFYVAVGLLLWLAVLKSGVHATIAGVALAMTVPARQEGGVPPLRRLEEALHPWVSFAVMPVFALFNAAVVVEGSLVSSLAHPATLGIVLGLVIGKPVGIVLFSWIAVRLRVAQLPEGVGWPHLAGVACLAGIGFTMSLFIAGLAFDAARLAPAKIGILVASALAGALGLTLVALATRRSGNGAV